MGFFNNLGKNIDLFLGLENENYERGVEFERTVAQLFNQRYFVIEDWTRDLSDKHKGFKVEADSGPDLIIRYRPSNEKFAVECKYRSRLYEDKLEWTTWEKLDQYNQYAQENKIPLFIVIGLFGYPNEPERMFCIPLGQAKYPDLYPSIFEKFERNPRAGFFWKNGVLI